MNPTKRKILDTAERLFAEYGYSATSLRHIIAEARVNLASIHYHFGTKMELLEQVLLRKAVPMNERRLMLLDRFESEASPRPAPVEKILEAFVDPVILTEKSPDFVKLLGRMYAEGIMPQMAQRHFQPMINRFLSALRRALPELREEELLWRMYFAAGALAHVLTARPEALPGTRRESPSVLSRMLIEFLSNGFRGPAALKKGMEVNP